MKHVYLLKTDFLTDKDDPMSYYLSTVDGVYSSEMKVKARIEARSALYGKVHKREPNALTLISKTNQVVRIYYVKEPVL